MRRLRVLTRQEEIVPEKLAGATAVVIDVFLATTTLVAIVEAGARRVLPVAGLPEMERVCAGLDPASLLRGGEQDARRVEGFDCGPYPAEYPPERVRGRDVVFVSTNGTRALAAAAGAGPVLVAGLRNAPAVGRWLRASATDDLFVVCAGSRGRFALEDFAAAGVLLASLTRDRARMDDAAWTALELAERHRDRIPELVAEGRAGRWFVEHGAGDVLEYAAAVGASEVVPELRAGELVRAGG